MALAGRLVIGVAPWRDPAAVQRAVLGWVDNSLNALADAGRGAFVAVADTGVVGLVTLGPGRISPGSWTPMSAN
jgi:hypothetical protein